MLKKLVLGVMFVALIGSATLVAVANDGQTLRELRWELAQRNLRPVPPEVFLIPTPMPPTLEPSPPHPYPIRPRFDGPCREDPQLFTYIAERIEALREAAVTQEASTPVFATINFKRPLNQAELDQLVSGYGLRLFNIYYVTNTDISGVCGQCNLSQVEARLRSEHGDLIAVEGSVAMEVAGTLGELLQLSEHPRVLLVDLAAIEEIEGAPGKHRAVYPHRVFYRYERACH